MCIHDNLCLIKSHADFTDYADFARALLVLLLRYRRE